MAVLPFGQNGKSQVFGEENLAILICFIHLLLFEIRGIIKDKKKRSYEYV